MAPPTRLPEADRTGKLLLKRAEVSEQGLFDLFGDEEKRPEGPGRAAVAGQTSTFLDNIRLPVHRWFRYSAGFSAEWVKSLSKERTGRELRVLDPFAGSGTTCLACDEMGVPSHGIEGHPFVFRVARAKLDYTADPVRLGAMTEKALSFASGATARAAQLELLQLAQSEA